jgi:amino-acid N-acetyltransferase
MLSEWILRPAHKSDLATVRELVEQCDLSPAGIEEQLDTGYIVAEVDGQIVGVAGIEAHGARALLRSVAVAPSMRGAGLGRALVQERVEWAAYRGLESVHLLTTTASGFFARHGFSEADRATAPEEIRATKEFTEMCPSTAILMTLAKGGTR